MFAWSWRSLIRSVGQNTGSENRSFAALRGCSKDSRNGCRHRNRMSSIFLEPLTQSIYDPDQLLSDRGANSHRRSPSRSAYYLFQ
jgi:hypothetical protein